MCKLIKRTGAIAIVAVVFGFIWRDEHKSRRHGHSIDIQTQMVTVDRDLLADSPSPPGPGSQRGERLAVPEPVVAAAPGRQWEQEADERRHSKSKPDWANQEQTVKEARSAKREQNPTGADSRGGGPSAGGLTYRSGEPPDWVLRGAWLEPPMQYRVVVSELWMTPAEAIDQALQLAAEEAKKELEQQGERPPADWHVPVELVRSQLVQDSYVQKREWQLGSAIEADMYRAYLLLRFAPTVRSQLQELARQAVVAERMRWAGAGFGFVLCCLLTTVVGLKLDDWLRGYYSRWILAGSLAFVAACAAALALLAF